MQSHAKYSGRIPFGRALHLAGFLLCATGLVTSCTGSSKADDQALGAVALALLSGSNCVMGGVSFSKAGVVCAGAGATGTGTLTAVGNSQDDLSIEITFSLGSSGSIQFLGGSNLSAAGGIVNRGIGFQITAAGTTPLGITGSGTSVAALAGGTDSAKTFCVEMHLAETYGHLGGKAAACPSGTEAIASLAVGGIEKEGNVDLGGGAHGSNRGWGFVLSNASIQSISVNASRKFTE